MAKKVTFAPDALTREEQYSAMVATLPSKYRPYVPKFRVWNRFRGMYKMTRPEMAAWIRDAMMRRRVAGRQ